jgi:NTE family protein
MASAALPIVFPAVRLGDEFYGDGSVSHLAPLAPALHLGARAVVAIGPPRAGTTMQPDAGVEYPSAAEVIGLLFRAIFLDTLEADAERLERVNRTLAALPPGPPAPQGLRAVELLMLRPSRDLGDLAAGHDKLLPPMMRLIVRAMGGQREAASDFLGNFLFHPAYTSLLAELGYEDVAAQWPAIEGFFQKLERTE